MRLIDADLLKVELLGRAGEQTDRLYKDTNAINIYSISIAEMTDIEKAETVEAIPVEWIENYITKISWEDEQAVIQDMLDRWEKENGN